MCGRSCGSTTPSPWWPITWEPRRKASRPWSSNGTTARTQSSARRTSWTSSNRRRSSRAWSRRTSATSTRRCRVRSTKVEATYHVPFLAHATMEPMNCTVHVRPDGCEIWVGNQAIARAQTRGREGRRPAVGQGRGAQPSDRRRLRPAAGERRRRARRRDRQAGRRPGQGGLDARRRHPARHVPADVLRPPVRRSRRERHAGRVEQPLRRTVDYREMAAGRVQQRPRSRHHRRRHRPGLWPAELSRRICAGGAAGYSDRVLAQRRSVAQRLRDRKLHGRTGCGGQAGPGRLPARSARQDAARQGRPCAGRR